MKKIDKDKFIDFDIDLDDESILMHVEDSKSKENLENDY